MTGPIYIFAGGGSGGHLYPALAVADELLRLRPEAKVVFACSGRAIDRRILQPLPHGIVVQPVRPLPRRAGEVPGFLWAWWRSRRLAGAMLADLKPAAVLGLGGFAAGPVICRTAGAAVPAALLNPDAVPGRANRHLGRYARVIFTQFANTAACFGTKVAHKVRNVGCPVRHGFAEADRVEAMVHFALEPARKTLLVNGGSQGAASINEAVVTLCGQLRQVADTWQLLHITGPARTDEVARPEVGAMLPANRLEYCDRMDLAYAAADLALCRCGASTAAELAVSHTPAVILPYPYHADRQQRLNAQPLARAGAAVVCDDAADAAANAETLRRHLVPLLCDPIALEAMRKAAASLARPHAARAVAGWLARYG